MLDFDLTEESIDRRTSNRVPFAGRLGVAQYDEGVPADQSTFRYVKGFNLSHSGISFSTPAWPTSDLLMVSLGDLQCPALVKARVVACGRTSHNDNESLFEVRCEFVKWLN